VGRLAHLSRQGLDLVSFWQAASNVLTPAIPHHMSPCWYTLDPDSLLMTSHYSDDIAEIPREWLEQEYFADDVNQLIQVARSKDRVSTLHEATGGNPASSPRWHQNMEYGGDQELIAALAGRDGRTWGALGLYRAPGQPRFELREIEFLRQVAVPLAEGARRALTLGEAKEPEGTDAPAIVILDRTWSLESATATARTWVDALPGGDWDRGRMPPSVLSVASRASGGESKDPARVTTLTRSGIWATVTAEPFIGERSGRIAVVIERASPSRIAPILMDAFGLTEREQEVTRCILQGTTTSAIAQALFISPHTVQEHLKRIFDKTGARSRRELTARVFFTHYEPRVRDNETRAARDGFLRGGPKPAAP
jgi:DNA-binding CsgD family transcriptional regulator